MTELEHVLDSLLHDLRTPVGIASGYVRLLREGRIASGEETDRILANVQQALRTVSTLCADADLWMQPDERNAQATVPASRIASLVAARLRELGTSIVERPVPADAVVTVRGETELLCTRLAELLDRVVRPRGIPTSRTVTIAADAGQLRFSAAAAPRAGASPSSPFDPWGYPGLTVPLGCRAIEHAGGVWSCPQDGGPLLQVVFRFDGAHGERVA